MRTLKFNRNIFIIAAALMLSSLSYAQVYVEVNMDVNHQVGGNTSFDRSKWMVVSSSQSSGVWSDVMDKLDYIVNDLDTYFGRETGHIKTASKKVNEDPNRTGYADTTHIKSLGDADIIKYSNKTDRFQYEKGDFIVANQQLPLFPNGNNATNGGWFYSSADTPTEPFGTASGEFCAHYFNHYYGDGGTSGFPFPTYFEIMNEPIWHFVDADHDGGGTVEQVFKFHQTVADIIHEKVPGLQVGGYGAAFPDLDKGGDLKQWDERWRRFIEEYGSSFDFYTLHLYDKPIWYGKEVYRKGGRNEATFDLIEHFNELTYGRVKPLLITEYGTQLWGLTDEERLWRPYNDWARIKAFNAMLMQFLERPNTILRALPFAVPKGEWGYDSAKDIPYRCRLLRKANEPEEYSGDWVWTEYIKFYELWSDVKGLRLDTYADNLDFQVDAYVDGNNVFVVMNNIENVSKEFDLNLKGFGDNELESVEVKRLYFSTDQKVVLDVESLNSFDGVKQLKGDETIIAKYTYKNPLKVDQTSRETKYYASTYKQAIVAESPVSFTFNNIKKSVNGEAVLRLGLARNINSNHFPKKIKINGKGIKLPENYRGDIQTDRDNFFGMLEVQIPYFLLQEGINAVEVIFSDTDGFISSSAIQVLEFSRAINRPLDTSVPDYIQGNGKQNKSTKIYPVPVKNKLTIEGDVQSWKVISMAGDVLLSGVDKEIQLGHLSTGSYLIQLDDLETKIFTKQ
ncbi:hypothetical protein [Labilibacter marinus]|uniref:hypothetical protein n=1 Tax=Labilibacter marinus TaxID=1477105 RepID=UPI00094FB887|nr:hypothetical protein [Labilibacter marinus]